MTKRLIALTMIIGLLSLTACGTQTTTSETESQTEQISTEAVTLETETTSLEQETTETEFIETPTTDTSTSSEYNDDENEIRSSKWADINGAWDAVHQYEIYAQENGADYAFGWTWCYDHGKGAGDQPSYAVYMKEGDPLYGTVYHVGDYLPDGTQFREPMMNGKLSSNKILKSY